MKKDLCGQKFVRSLMPGNILLRIVLISAIVLFSILGAQAEDTTAAKSTGTYDVSGEGMVHVTLHPMAGSLFIPVTAEKIFAKDLEYTSVKNWEKFRLELMVKLTGPNPTLSYDWPDGALPWPVKTSDWLAQSPNVWFTDNFYTVGPADVTIILPKGSEVFSEQSYDCPKQEEKAPDGRVSVTYSVPAGKTLSWLGMAYTWPWAEKYSVYGGSPLPLYYPTVLNRYPEYMAKIKLFSESCMGFYKTYETELGCRPPYDIGMYAISWVYGFGAGAYTCGYGTYYNYRGMAAYEYPMEKAGVNMMGSYHEMSHAFQPDGYPWFMGGHTWSKYLTRDYDWNIYPTVNKVASRKRAGGYPEQECLMAHRLFKEMNMLGLVPGAWDTWPEKTSPEVEAFLDKRNCPLSFTALHEAAQAGAMIKMDAEFGQTFWGKFQRVFLSSGMNYMTDLTTTDVKVVQKAVAAQMGVAQGRDLTAYLSDLIGCDLSPKLVGEGKEILTNGNMEATGTWILQPTQPGPALSIDKKVKHSGKQSLKLVCENANDVKISQKVKVEPSTYYLLTAMVKTKGVPFAVSGVRIWVNDTYTRHLRGDNDWQRITMLVNSCDNSELEISLRLGEPDLLQTVGTVWFDDAEMIPLFTKRGWEKLVSLGSPEVGTRK